MSRFVDSIFVQDTGNRHIRQRPMSLEVNKQIAYSIPDDGIVNDYEIKAVFQMNARVPEKTEHELIKTTRKALIEHIYGDLKGMLHEVKHHLYNHDVKEAQRAMADVFREIDG